MPKIPVCFVVHLRINCLSAGLCQQLRGRNIILSSGAQAAFELRGPYDIINIASLLGLNPADAKASVALLSPQLLEHLLSVDEFALIRLHVDKGPCYTHLIDATLYQMYLGGSDAI